MVFSGDTLVCAEHDYLKYVMSFSLIIEQDNPDIDPHLKSYTSGHVCSLFSDELKAPTYLRFNNSRFIEVLKKSFDLHKISAMRIGYETRGDR